MLTISIIDDLNNKFLVKGCVITIMVSIFQNPKQNFFGYIKPSMFLLSFSILVFMLT